MSLRFYALYLAVCCGALSFAWSTTHQLASDLEAVRRSQIEKALPVAYRSH